METYLEREEKKLKERLEKLHMKLERYNDVHLNVEEITDLCEFLETFLYD
jgi:hypothetical protein